MYEYIEKIHKFIYYILFSNNDDTLDNDIKNSLMTLFYG